MHKRSLFLAVLMFCVLVQAALAENSALDASLLQTLAQGGSEEKIAAITQMAKDSPEQALPILQSLADSTLYTTGERFLYPEGNAYRDALTRILEPTVPAQAEPVTVNNRIRKKLGAVLAGLNLFAHDRATRMAAADNLAKNAETETLALIESALAKEQEPAIAKKLLIARGKAGLASPDAAIRKRAVEDLATDATLATRQLLLGVLAKSGDLYAEQDAGVRQAASASLRAVERKISLGDNLGRMFTGLSLGSILLLAAMGLAITYGVMGVINMAHGELLMVGAYATYAVQSLFRAYLPAWIDWYLPAALPCGFLAAACVGMLLERLVIRHLYGRPLETLLATWGLSLFLIQGIRSLFGAQNVEVANPSWMSGGLTILPNLVLPWNRVMIIGFALAVLFGMWAIMNLTRLGLFVRAVTQNRPIAACMGVSSGAIDTLAFGLGAGIAGLGGVALSQVSNVGPDMGQSYIVDSFMVVVLGGVGQLAGAVWASLGLGVIGKFLEGWTGAVIAKIVVLVIVIIFIQKRPQGLFALKGRTVES